MRRKDLAQRWLELRDQSTPLVREQRKIRDQIVTYGLKDADGVRVHEKPVGGGKPDWEQVAKHLAERLQIKTPLEIYAAQRSLMTTPAQRIYVEPSTTVRAKAKVRSAA